MTKSNVFSNLTARMIMIVIIMHLFFLNILYFGLGAVVEKGYKSQFVDYVRADAFNFAANMSGSSPLIYNINTQALEEAVLTGRTVFLRVIDKNNKVVEEIGAFGKGGKFIEDFIFGGSADNIYHIEAELQDFDHQYLGKIQIGYDETDTQEQIDLAYQRCFLFSVIYALIAFIFTSYFGQRMTRPIQTLQKLTRTIAHGHYHTKVEVKTNVIEIESLANTIEFMREELVAQSDSMEHLALHDSLTGLPNRVLLQDRVTQTVNSDIQTEHPCVLVIIDLNRFKEINDSFGHLIGDSVLKKTAIGLVNSLRSTDTVARLGGDEFAIFLPETNIATAMIVIEKMAAELSRPFECEGHSVILGASIGLASFPEHGSSYEELLQKADIAMYVAKRAGISSQIYQTHFSQDALLRLTLISELKFAIEKEQLFATFQPKIDLQTNELIGVELLVRWLHPERGVIPPNDFIASAERGGLISQLTQWVLRAGIKQAADWYKNGRKIPVAINLSPKNLVEEGLYQGILSLLEEYQLPANLLELEITESSMFADPLTAKKILEDLHAVGIKIAIDDFGTGYSSLVQLRNLPISILKIDRSFVFNMSTDANDAAIVNATVYMAHMLGMKVVAEGVEDQQTLNQLKELKCDFVQGYLFARPMKISDFEHWYQSSYNNHNNT
ncbi:putative bifunctional diguanylate cyclase/phosphodiesterase [Colwellia sp. TT2012]|uniref:putative bifunctional diguanylate cyclase/phosphodiesterase n=1 Tax=Colwellia sp. TT2012 TaxID=1720342 RepID=UPI000710990F|nr:EAL domain-containing protein [Colwellia sp. TT2012]